MLFFSNFQVEFWPSNQQDIKQSLAQRRKDAERLEVDMVVNKNGTDFLIDTIGSYSE
jgi:hypothetical protein